jgi:hypothetical protein
VSRPRRASDYRRIWDATGSLYSEHTVERIRLDILRRLVRAHGPINPPRTVAEAEACL